MTDHCCEECGCCPILCECPIELTSPVPELPVGYSTRDGSSVYDLWYNHTLLAWFTFGDNLELTDEGAKGKHAQALAIWLQRTTNK